MLKLLSLRVRFGSPHKAQPGSWDATHICRLGKGLRLQFILQFYSAFLIKLSKNK
jgi:hypothetical protein